MYGRTEAHKRGPNMTEHAEQQHNILVFSALESFFVVLLQHLTICLLVATASNRLIWWGSELYR